MVPKLPSDVEKIAQIIWKKWVKTHGCNFRLEDLAVISPEDYDGVVSAARAIVKMWKTQNED